MRPPQLVLRCYVKPQNDQWVAICIDLCLAAQADSLADARRKLEAQIASYVEEALTIDREFADELLSRKAPFAQRAEYYSYRALHSLHLLKSRMGRVFNTILPVHVGPGYHA